MTPFGLIYEAIYNISLQNAILQQYIKANNYVKLDQKTHTKANISTADLPELILSQTNVTGNLTASSSRSSIVAIYNWIVTQGSWDLAHLTSELQWGLLTASATCCERLGSLRWNEEKFLHNVELGNIEVTVIDSENNRGIQGWSINWPLLITMQLSRNELRNYQCQDH